MPSSRRELLGLLGGAVTAGIAGCGGSGSSSDAGTVRLGVSNFTPEERELRVEALPAGVTSGIQENALFDEWIDLGPSESDRSYRRRPDAFEERKALVRVHDGRGYVGQYTFVPDCPPERPGEAVEVALYAPGRVRFTQNRC